MQGTFSTFSHPPLPLVQSQTVVLAALTQDHNPGDYFTISPSHNLIWSLTRAQPISPSHTSSAISLYHYLICSHKNSTKVTISTHTGSRITAIGQTRVIVHNSSNARTHFASESVSSFRLLVVSGRRQIFRVCLKRFTRHPVLQRKIFAKNLKTFSRRLLMLMRIFSKNIFKTL